MAPLGWSGGSQFSSTVLPDGVPVTVSMRGGEGAEGMAVGIRMKVHLRAKFAMLNTHTGKYLNEGAEKQDTRTHTVQVAIYTINQNN